MPAIKKNLKPFKTSNFSQKQLLFFAAIFGFIGGYFIFRAFAVPPAPTIYLSQASQTLATNTVFNVEVREDSGGSSVNAAQANLSYPTTLLDIVSVNTASSAFSVEAQTCPGPDCEGSPGVINIGRGTCGGCAPLTGDRLVATVTFRTKTTGGTANVSFTSGTALVSSSSNQDILGSLAATGGGSYTVDTVAPTVSVSSPSNGAVISKGATVNVTASASDAGGVSNVEFLVDGASTGTDSTSPYTYNWSTSSLTLGSHSLQARATDASGNVATSSTITVTIADQTAPTVSLSAPSNGSGLKGTVSINATASDNSGGTGVAKVEFYVDGTLKSTDTSSPYSYSWNTTTATNAAHSLTAKAYDNASPANSATSAVVSVTVDNSAPTVPGNFRTTGNSQSSITLAWNASNDNNAVSSYRLTRNGSVIATLPASSSSYNDGGLAAGTTYSYTLVAVDTTGNTSAAANLSASTKPATPGDVNSDDKVDIVDLSILLANWNTANAASDINGNGTVDIFDLSILLSNWTG